MSRSLRADIVLILHFIFAFFAVFGGFLVFLDWRIALLHIPTVLWSSIVNLMDWTCPLTPLEKKLREQAGQQVYDGGCIKNYIEPLVRPLGMPRRMEWIAGISVLVWNVIVYAIVIWRMLC